MFSVTFRGNNRRTQRFKTEKGALRSIWKWLKANDSESRYTATIIGPGLIPRTIEDWKELPFEEEQKRDFLKTGRWKRLKQLVYERDGNYCACCGKSPKDGVVLHIDHIKPRSLYPELEDDLDNLQVLCKDCNEGKFNLSEMKYR